MIRNDHQLRLAYQELEELKAELEQFGKEYAGQPEALAIECRQIGHLLTDTEQDIADYLKAKQGELPAELHTLDPETGKQAIGRTLFLLRLAQGLTQEELARRLRTKQPAVNRWESEGYAGYTVGQLQEIARQLGRELDIVFRDNGASAHRTTPE